MRGGAKKICTKFLGSFWSAAGNEKADLGLGRPEGVGVSLKCGCDCCDFKVLVDFIAKCVYSFNKVQNFRGSSMPNIRARLPENKKDFRVRLNGLGLWRRVIERRKQLEKTGISAGDCWVRLMDEFSPGRCMSMKGAAVKVKVPAKATAPTPVVLDENGNVVKRGRGRPRKISNASTPVAPPSLMFPMSIDDDGNAVAVDVSPVVEAVDAIDDDDDDAGDNDEYDTDAVYIDGKKVGRDVLANGMPLVDAKTWDGRPGVTFEESVLWADSMRAIKNVKPKDCPSAVAYEKLWSAQNSTEGARYLDSLIAKITAKRKSTDDDDAADITAYTARLLEMVESAKSETRAAS